MSALNKFKEKSNFSNSGRGWTPCWKDEKLSLLLRQDLKKTQGTKIQGIETQKRNNSILADNTS